MRYKITARGVYDAENKMIEIGSVVTAKADAGWLVGKAEIIGDDAKPRRVAVTNPAAATPKLATTQAGNDP